ncbi:MULTISPECIES: hypothetical protein [unclassified Curtobacterium]|uniref:hypothetical protein n=1 Tax=unclassified Curtobacterium TaxID=257496 RepID=UPI000DA82C53|nr:MULTISPECIES: hypothetical protein [unclassified Curtobacterium]PZE79165.1 hypothetical protein DEI91_15745 [Curtobacterium sp. MCBD17_032]PZE87829.1 hypothetical protein DEI95_16310 [Curtobacterium sp. MCBD17_008]
MQFGDGSRNEFGDWPAEMLITEERREHALLMLLFLGSRTTTARHDEAPRGQGDARWVAAWTASIAELAARPPSRPDADDGVAAARAWRGRLSEHLGRGVIDDDLEDAYETWLETVAPVDADMSFDDGVLPDLVAAWVAGLRTLVVIPVTAPVAVRLSGSTLMVSSASRSEVNRLGAALRAFAAAPSSG